MTHSESIEGLSHIRPHLPRASTILRVLAIVPIGISFEMSKVPMWRKLELCLFALEQKIEEEEGNEDNETKRKVVSDIQDKKSIYLKSSKFDLPIKIFIHLWKPFPFQGFEKTINSTTMFT